MKKILLILGSILSIQSVSVAQKTMPLYDRQAPNSKITSFLTDTALVFPMGNELGHFIIPHRLFLSKNTSFLSKNIKVNCGMVSNIVCF